MEPSPQTISSRRDKLNAQILGRNHEDHRLNLLNRESLLDAFQALYDECSIESLQKYDKQIAHFVEKYKTTVSEVKRLRVNITDFDIKDVIGRGHFGEVHVVKEKQTGDIYAMKTIRKSESVEKTSFDVERDIMAFSQSPWITSLQYAFQDNNYLFYVMEYHPGGDLLGLLYRQGGTLPESAATFYLAEIVLALADLHKMGFVHRDVKPDNILLDRCGHLKLVDFGSAAKLNSQGLVNSGVAVGTPDYVAPEVLQTMDEKNTKRGYGVSCDYWSLGILAYELTIGKPPFSGSNTTVTYSRIINHTNYLKFPNDILLTQAYTSFIKSLITDEKNRLNLKQIKEHCLFKNYHFDTLRDQVPPFVPKITSSEDTSNFVDIVPKKNIPSIENFKKKTQFSGRNLPFIGFTFIHGFNTIGYERKSKDKDELIKNLREEMESMKRKLLKSEDFEEVRINLEKKILEKTHKLESIESVRNKLERDLAANIAENTALKRTLEIERKDRSELERKALDLIKSAKIKWETSERTKVEALKLEIEQQKLQINQLIATNNMLNDQLKKAFKLENKHKDSLDAVEQMNRRSLIGLESKLEKVAIENRQKMMNLQSNLDETIEEKKMLEKEIKRLKDNEENLLKKLDKLNEEYSVLNGAAIEAEKLVQELNGKVNNFEKEMEDCDCLKKQVESLMKEVDSYKEKIKNLDLKVLKLEQDNKKIEDYKKELNQLKEIKLQNEKKITEIDSKFQEEEQKCISLKKQLENSETLINESQQLKDLRMKMWKTEKELSNAKIDKRIVDRELKEATQQIKDLNVEIESLKNKIEENRKIYESAMLELNNINENLSLELVKSKEAIRGFENQFENEKSRNKEDKELINRLKSELKEKEDLIREKNNDWMELKNEILEIKERMMKSEDEKKSVLDELTYSRKENQKLTEEINDVRTQLENNQTNLEALREACIIIENQVIEYEKINASIQSEKSQMAENTEKLIKDLCKAKEDIQEAKKLANEEKSYRLLAETKVKRLTEDIESLQNECQSYKDQFIKYRECSNNLSEELTICEEKNSELEVTVKSYERQIEEFISENNILKEEISQYLTQISGLKESNFKMKQQINELKICRNLLNEKVEELEAELNAKINYYEEREMKNQSIIKQQTKLIDYLQVKIDEHSNKKKTFTDKLFGHSKKENQQPLALTTNYKDLEVQLQKQKQLNKNLQEEIYKLKALNCRGTPQTKISRHKSEITSPTTKLAIEQLVKEPSEGIDRMYHNIPHRFVNKLCRKLRKCDYCTNQIMLGRDVSVCNECHMTCHVTCVSNVKSTCGLPQGYAKHFKDSLTRLNECKFENWIKILNKNNQWEKRYACLTDTNLKIYSNSDKDSLVDCIDLGDTNNKKKLVLEPVQSEIGVNIAPSDLPFIMKIEISTNCWPVSSFLLMALSMDDRDRWFKAFQSIFNNSSDKYHLETILTLPDQISINCIIDLDKKTKLLGTDQGLYIFSNSLCHIDGLSEVHNIDILPESNIILMTVGLSSILVSTDLNHVLNLSHYSPVLTYRNIPIKDLDNFHFLQVSKFGKHQLFCVATSKQLVIVKYDLEMDDFVPLRIMDTAEPLGCALFTEHSLVVGADKFFEIDLSNFKAEEFLDVSDLKLKHVVKCHKMQSFPLAILQVNDSPKEYLLCFNELVVFVDEYGRSSRDWEVKSTNLPIGFYYIKPFLYIMQFNGVEILKLDDFEKSVIVDLKEVKFLGTNKLGVYLLHDGKIKSLEARKLVEFDDCTSIGSSEVEESERFSFTSSIVQSLDGHLSDGESSEENLKRVKFSQTEV